MKALTVMEPWATLVFRLDAYGVPFKQVETRSWKTNYRGKLAIHAGKRKLHKSVDFFLGMSEEDMTHFMEAGIDGDKALDQLVYGAIIGEVEVSDCVPMEELRNGPYARPGEMAFGDWSDGRYGWLLSNPVLYEKPIPAAGKLGLWEWEAPDG